MRNLQETRLDKVELVQQFNLSPESLIPKALAELWSQPIFKANITYDTDRQKWVKKGGKDWQIPKEDKSALSAPAYGILLGYGIVVLDIDNHDGVDGKSNYEAWLETNGESHVVTFAVATPSGGTHYYYRTRKPLDRITVPSMGIDLIAGKGKFIVGALSKYELGTYEIVNDSDIAELPDWVESMFSEFQSETKKTPPTTPSVTIVQTSASTSPVTYTPALREALSRAKLAGAFADHKDWLNLGFALKSAGASVDDWIELSDGTNDSVAGCFYAWKSASPVGGVTGKTLNYYASKYGGTVTGTGQLQAGTDEWFTAKFVKIHVGKDIEFYRKGGSLEDALPKESFCLKFTNYITTREEVTKDSKGTAKTRVVPYDPARNFSMKSETALFKFSPSQPEFFHDVDSQLCYNAFMGFPHQGKPIDQRRTDIILDFLREVICDNDEQSFEFLLDYMARKLQMPERKLGIIIALQSHSHGVGKGLFFKIVSELSNPKHAMANEKMGTFRNRFNSEYVTKFWSFINEAVMTMADAEILKSLTEREWKYEPKGKVAFSAPNYTDIVIATNLDWSAPIESSDRRFFSLALNEKYTDSATYYVTLNDAIEHGGLAGIDNMLRQRVIKTPFGTNNCIPDTLSKAKNFWHGTPEVVKWVVKWQYGQVADKTQSEGGKHPILHPRAWVPNSDFDELLQTYGLGNKSNSAKKALTNLFPNAVKLDKRKDVRGLVFDKGLLLSDLRTHRAGRLLTEDIILS